MRISPSGGQCHTLDGKHNLIATINCPECNRGYRVPVYVRYKTPDEVPTLVENVRQMEKSGVAVETLDAAGKQILTQDPCNKYAWELLVSCADKSDDPVKAARLMEQLIFVDPYNPVLFESMAERLGKLGFSAPREKYVKKAAHLNRVGVTHTAPLGVTMPPEQLQKTIRSQFERR